MTQMEPRQKKLLAALLVFTLLALPVSQSHAASLFDSALELLGDWVDDRQEKRIQDNPNDPMYKAALADGLPKHWRQRIFREPVFNSEILIAEAGDTAKPVLLLVHGLGQLGMRDWIQTVPALTDFYHVILLDLPGFGASATPRGRYSPSNYAKVLAELKHRYSPNAPITVVGHSMGGAVTLCYASMYPEHIQHAILVDAAGILERAAFSKHAADFSSTVTSYPKFVARLASNTQNKSDSFIEILNRLPDPTKIITNDTVWGKTFSGRTNINAALALVEEDFSSAVFENKVKMDFISGENDDIAPLRTGYLLNKHILNSRLVVIDDAEHVPMKTHTEEFNRKLLNLLLTKTPNLQLDTPERNIQGRLDSDVANAKKPTLHCKDQFGGTYSGEYSKVIIENCNDVVLTDIVTHDINIKDSRIEFRNVSIKQENEEPDEQGFVVTARESVIVATNLNLESKNGMRLERSRMDIAGAKISVDEIAVQIEDKSRLIFSISEIQSQNYNGYMHGLYSIREGALRDRL